MKLDGKIKIGLIALAVVIYTIIALSIEPFSRKSRKNKKNKEIKSIPKQIASNGRKYKENTLNDLTKIYQYSAGVSRGETPKMKNRLLNHRMKFMKKLREMINGRRDRLSKVMQKYPKDSKEVKSELDSYIKMLRKIPVNKKYDFRDILTKSVDKRSAVYKDLYHLGTQMNDFKYNTDLCTKDSDCSRFVKKMHKVYDKRQDVLDDMYREIAKSYKNVESFTDSTTTSNSKCKRPDCTIRGLNYGIFCGPLARDCALDEDFKPCGEVDNCCKKHNIKYRKCEKRGDPCLATVTDSAVSAGFCPTLCTTLADMEMCGCMYVNQFSDDLTAYAYSVGSILVFCNPLKYVIASVVGAIYLLVNLIIEMIMSVIDFFNWIGGLFEDLSDWFGETDFEDWLNSWLREDSIISSEESEEDIYDMISDLGVSVISAEGTPADQVERIIISLDNVVYTADQRGIPNYGPSTRDIINPDDLRNERRPPSDIIPMLPEKDIRCSQACYNGYPGIRCINNQTGEVVSETWDQYQNREKCCRNECIDDTWHTVCPPASGIDTRISCDEKAPKL